MQEDRGFRGVQYSASVANFFDDQNMRPDASWHPKIKDVVYFGMRSYLVEKTGFETNAIKFSLQ